MYLGWCPYMHVLCALAACVPAPSHSITLTFRRRSNAAAPPMPTPYGRRLCTIAVGRRRRFAFLSFAAAAVTGDNGRRLSAELWVGTSMYIRMYTTTHSGRRDSGVCGAALTAARRAASTYLVVVDI